MTFTQLRRRMNRKLHERSELRCTTVWRKNLIRALYIRFTRGECSRARLLQLYP